jgi:hypothetical protein
MATSALCWVLAGMSQARIVIVHDDQIDISLGQVVALVSDQLPDLAMMDVVAVTLAREQ